ncbi:MAG: hypothetical protein ABI888_04385 [Chloroflexota bacterium]
MSEQDTAEFPFPADASDEERAQAKREIGKHARIAEETPPGLKIAAKLLGQTGPIWHFQYTRIYALPKGFLAAGHDIREGIKVSYADDLEDVADDLGNDGVREFILDELRFRGHLKAEHAGAH